MDVLSPETQGAGDTRPRSAPITGKDEQDALGVKVTQLWKDGSDDLSRQRRDYWLNLSYFSGEQWIWWDRQRRTVQQLPQQYSPLGSGRARVTVNRIAPNVGSVTGRMLKSELAFEILPSGIADDITEGARRAERVLAAYHRHQDWEQVRYDALLSAIFGGTSAVSVDWDGRAGKRLKWDEQTGQVVGTGDPKLNSLNINEFCLETNTRTYQDSRYWIQGIALDPTYIKSHYNLPWDVKPDVGGLLTPLQSKLLSDTGRAGGQRLALVLSYYERPNQKNQKGRYAIVVNGKTIHDEAWPFPFERLNLCVFRQTKLPAMWAGRTYMNDAVSIQFAYNHARSVITEHMKLAGNARLTAPYGAFDEEALTDDPGSVLFYQADQGVPPPGYMSPPGLPGWMLDEAQQLKAELDDVMFVHDTSRGVGFDRASGSALAILGEKDDGPLGTMVFEQRKGWSDLGSMVLQVLGKKGTETRKLTIPAAPGIPEVIEWSGKMLREQYDVTVPLEAVMPRTHAASLAHAKDLWDRQIITDPRLYAKMAGLKAEQFSELLNPDAASANRENFRMMVGHVEIPEDFEDHAIHIAEHNRLRKSDSFKYGTEENKSIVKDHIRFHEQLAHEQLGEQTQRAAMDPALAMVPQGAAPVGSEIPATALEQQAVAAQQMAGAGGAANSPAMPGMSGGGGVPPGMEGLAGMVTAPVQPPEMGAGGP